MLRIPVINKGHFTASPQRLFSRYSLTRRQKKFSLRKIEKKWVECEYDIIYQKQPKIVLRKFPFIRKRINFIIHFIK